MRIPSLAFLTVLGGLGAAGAVTPADWHAIYPATNCGRPGECPAVRPQNYAFETGSGTTAARDAAYFRKTGGEAKDFGTLERSIPLDAWRGKRVHITLPVKLEGEGNALAWAWVGKSNGVFVRAVPQPVAAGGAWQSQQFVMDVPDNATGLAVSLRLRGKDSTLWMDDIKLEAAGADMSPSRTTRLSDSGPIDTGGGGGAQYTPPNIK